MVAKQTVLTQQLLFLNGFCITLRAFQKSQNQKHEVWKNWCFTGFRFQRLISKTCRGMTCKRKTHNNCNLQRLTKELRQKRTGHRHGKQKKTPANHPDGTTEVLKVHIRRFATKEQYEVTTVGRYKALQ